ncbi:AAA domain-containing protein [Halomarina halobia]|uniref:DNA helicase n=1 Tax=Halomarina halobia TaxID=3033386 RepID=A0ABD6A4J7_9EURY|nr:AAA domain-containing protein [Halomarina sp. PSR21]
MTLRGPVVEVNDPRTVETRYGERELAEVRLRPDGGAAAPATVTLWGKWAETAEVLDPGMELLVTDPEEREWNGETTYGTSKGSLVVVEPDFLVDVTDVRSWVQCPRMYYLNKLSGVPLNYPVVMGTLVHEVFGDLLRGRDLEAAIDDHVADAGLELGLLGRDREEVTDDVRRNARAIEGWLSQGRLGGDGGDDGASIDDPSGDDSNRDFGPERSEWRSEQTLVGERVGIKGRADAVRRGVPVELKTGKNLRKEPRFQDKVQAACYALLLAERDRAAGTATASDGGRALPDTGTLLYTKNSALDRNEETGDLTPAKDFSIGSGLVNYVLRQRNAIAATEARGDVPTGYEADAKCEYCFERDTCMVVSGRLDQESKAGSVGRAVPEEEREYFDRLYRAIEEERREVHREYAKLWEQTAAERADDDRALVDLEPVGNRQRDDGRWELRAAGTDAVSKIREGDVVLASDGHPTRGTAELARVERLSPEVVVTTDEPVELRRLDVYPSELSVDRMLTALHDAVLKGSTERKDVLFGRRAPRFSETDGTFIDNNDAQDRAVRLAVTAEDCALIQGPPGTGKTYTLARTVRALVERGERVLLSAFTNRAVDNALEALREQGFDDFVRIGTETGIREDVLDHRLDPRGDPGERVRELRSAPVVAATTASCGSRILRECSFDAAVIDEAGQLTEPATLAAVNLADRFVLVGDHQQLPPVVRSENALRRSLFERLVERYPEASVLLDRQYRMSQRIQYFSSTAFYDGRLRPATPEVAGRRLDDLDGVDADALPTELRDAVTFVDPDGRAAGNTNAAEAARVREVVEAYLAAGVAPGDVGVIAPFRAQVAEIGRRVPAGVAVDTVDRFQGSAKEVVVVSFVATGSLDGPIFEDHRRVNVALTRAKRALCLVGDAAALESDPFYADMLDWARGRSC